MKHVIVMMVGLIMWVITNHWLMENIPGTFWLCVVASFILGWNLDDIYKWLKHNWP